MKKAILLSFLSSCVFGTEGRCLKCEALREYHENAPCSYEYYEDYLKACQEGKETPKEIDVNDLVRKKQNIKSVEPVEPVKAPQA